MRTTRAAGPPFRPALAAALAVLLTACTQAPVVLLPMDEHGAVIHPDSQFAFPSQVGPFVRVNVKHHDPKGASLSSDYTLGTTAVMTVFVYPEAPADGPPGNQFDREFQNLKIGASENQDLHLLSEAPVTVTQNGHAYEGQRITFEYRGSFGNVTQELFARHYLFLLGRHFIQYRVIYPATEDVKVSPLVQSFLNDLRWPGE